MIPIEDTDTGMLVFLQCGCSAWRCQAHPTREAFLIQIITAACEAHAKSEPWRVWAVRKGELVSPFVRSLEKAS